MSKTEYRCGVCGGHCHGCAIDPFIALFDLGSRLFKWLRIAY